MTHRRSSNGAVLEISPPPGGRAVASAPPVNLFMTRHAKRHEIVLVMRTAIAKRLDVMHERRRHKASALSAHLAQRFSCQMPVANPAPRTAVSLMLPIAASEAFVVSLHRLLVLFAVAALLVCEIRTACHAARAFRFPRHLAPLFGHEKSPRRFPSEGLTHFLFLLSVSYHIGHTDINLTFYDIS